MCTDYTKPKIHQGKTNTRHVIHVVVQQLLSSELMQFLSLQDFSKHWYYNLRKPSTTAYSIYSIYSYQKQ